MCCPFTLCTADDVSHLLPVLCISYGTEKSIIVLCDLCQKILVIYVFLIIKTYLLMLEHSDKNVINLEMLYPFYIASRDWWRIISRRHLHKKPSSTFKGWYPLALILTFKNVILCFWSKQPDDIMSAFT
jgi:hypothetical protein